MDTTRGWWIGQLPHRDWQANELTGVGRAHWASVADELLLGVRQYATPEHAFIDLPGSPSGSGVVADGLEGFARTFLLAAIRIAGDSGADPHGHLDFYRHGLIAGTRDRGINPPTSWVDASWPPIRSATAGGQPMVESASIALGLHLTKKWLWDTLETHEQAALEGWLREALRREPAPNNWFVFPLTVANFIDAIGHSDRETSSYIARTLNLLEGWYRGDGWYSDGDGRAFDHYIGWTMHAYPMLFAYLRSDAGLLERYGERLHRFLDDFCRLFDANGAPIYQGRSLTYRFAALTAPAIGALTGHTPLDDGQTRTLLSRTLCYFLERGAVSDGILTRGWHGPHAATVQGYSGPSSPYWAANGFLALLLPEDAPFWRAPERDPNPQPNIRSLASVGWLVNRTADGVVRLHNHGSDHIGIRQAEQGASNPLYSRYSYSTRTGPTASSNCPDNDLHIVIDGEASSRHRIHPLGTGADWAASWHTPVFSGTGQRGFTLPQARILALVISHEDCDVQIFRPEAVPAGTPIRLSGWAVSGDSADELSAVSSHEHTRPMSSVIHTVDDLSSELLGLHGFAEAEVERAPAGTAFGRWALVPSLRGTLSGVVVGLGRLSAEQSTALPLAERCAAVVDGTDITLTWKDGSHRIDFSDSVPSVHWLPL